MAIESIPALLDALRANHLLTDVQMHEAERSAGQFPGPHDLADDLVDRGWLTRYQAKQVVRGRGVDLTIGEYRVLDRLGQRGHGPRPKSSPPPSNPTSAR